VFYNDGETLKWILKNTKKKEEQAQADGPNLDGSESLGSKDKTLSIPFLAPPL